MTKLKKGYRPRLPKPHKINEIPNLARQALGQFCDPPFVTVNQSLGYQSSSISRLFWQATKALEIPDLTGWQKSILTRGRELVSSAGDSLDRSMSGICNSHNRGYSWRCTDCENRAVEDALVACDLMAAILVLPGDLEALEEQFRLKYRETEEVIEYVPDYGQ